MEKMNHKKTSKLAINQQKFKKNYFYFLTAKKAKKKYCQKRTNRK